MKRIICIAAFFGIIHHASAQNTFPASGNAGVGTATPSEQLEVSNATTGTIRLSSQKTGLATGDIIGKLDFYKSDPSTGGVGVVNSIQSRAFDQGGTFDLDFITGRTTLPFTAMTLHYNGRVGIGTKLPVALLQVNDVNTSPGSSGNLLISTTNAPVINLGGQLSFGGVYTGTTQTAWAGIAGRKENATDGDYAGYLQFITRKMGVGASEKMRLTSEGNLGIGTVLPQNTVDLGSATNGRGIAWGGTAGTLNYNNIYSSWSSAGLILASGFGGTTSTSDSYVATIGTSIARTGIRLNPFGTAAGAIQFFADAASVNAIGAAIIPTERMRITGTGNVGIGTTNPLDALDVRGNLRVGSGSVSTTAGILADSYMGISNSDLTKTRGIQFSAADGTYNPRVAINHITSATNQYMEFTSSYSSIVGRANWIFSTGNVGIGTTTTLPAGFKLAVNGNVIATAVTVKLVGDWPDYVFKKDYRLPTLAEVKDYIGNNQHLPGMPSEKEVAEKGINLGEMNKLLTSKVEELTLYLIEEQDKRKELEQKMNQMELMLKKLIKE